MSLSGSVGDVRGLSSRNSSTRPNGSIGASKSGCQVSVDSRVRLLVASHQLFGPTVLVVGGVEAKAFGGCSMKDTRADSKSVRLEGVGRELGTDAAASTSCPNGGALDIAVAELPNAGAITAATMAALATLPMFFLIELKYEKGVFFGIGSNVPITESAPMRTGCEVGFMTRT